MRSWLALNTMALPPPPFTHTDQEASDMRLDTHRSPATTILRAKVVLTAIALAAAIALVAVGSWPLKVLVVLAFVRGMFASDLVSFRNAPRRGSSDPMLERAMARGDG